MTDPAASLPAQAALPRAGLFKPAADAAGWQRVLQQAEQARWFLGASPAPPPQPRGGASLATHAGLGQQFAEPRVMESARTGGSQRPATAARSAGTKQPAELAGLPCPAERAQSRALIPCLLSQLPMEPSGGDAAPDRTSSEQARRVRESQTPLRIHLETTGNGLHVWLGIDGSADQVAARAAALLEEIRRQATQAGVRLSAVVCNGTTAYAASTHEDIP